MMRALTPIALVLGFVFVFLFGTCIGFAAGVEADASRNPMTWTSNRNWWQSLSAGEQLRVTQGELEGYDTGWTDALGDLANAAKDDPTISLADASAKIPLIDQAHKSFGEYRSEVSNWYADRPNAVAPVGSVLACLIDTPPSGCEALQ